MVCDNKQSDKRSGFCFVNEVPGPPDQRWQATLKINTKLEGTQLNSTEAKQPSTGCGRNCEHTYELCKRRLGLKESLYAYFVFFM